jgi:universal stress protein A
LQGFQVVLVPLDFSSLSERVLDAALRVLGPSGALHLIHVVEWMPLVTGGAIGVYPHRQEIERLKRLSRDQLAGYVRAHPEADLRVVVREGKPAPAILEGAEELRADLIVIGSQGRSGLDHLLIGSVAERVLRKASCPVLVVKAPPTP